MVDFVPQGNVCLVLSKALDLSPGTTTPPPPSPTTICNLTLTLSISAPRLPPPSSPRFAPPSLFLPDHASSRSRGGNLLPAMLVLPALRCSCPDDDADGDSGKWTGEKRRKPLGPYLPSFTGEVAEARIISSGSDAPEEQGPDLGVSIVLVREELLTYKDLLSKRRTILLSRDGLDLEQQREVYKRIVRRRMKLSRGECEDTPPPFLEQAMSLDLLHFHFDLYCLQLDEEEDGITEWYFDGLSKFDDTSDYQRLVLHNYLPTVGHVYWDWEIYRSLFTTYEMDKDYITFFKEMSSKLKWLKSLVDYPKSSEKWADLYSRGALQALKIAEQYPHMNCLLAYTAYGEFLWRLRFDCLHREDKADLIFEIWKRITKGQVDIETALTELLSENLFPRHKNMMLYARGKHISCGFKDQYVSCVNGISGNASEDDAKAFIRDAVWKLHKLEKQLHQYMARKMEIAESIGLSKLTDSQSCFIQSNV